MKPEQSTDKFKQITIETPFSSHKFAKLLELGANTVVSLTDSTFSSRKENQVLDITETGYINPNGCPVFCKKAIFDFNMEELKRKYAIER
jgi:hypothetical protein